MGHAQLGRTPNVCLAPHGIAAPHHSHIEDSAGISDLPPITDGQRVVAALQLELLEGQLDHLLRQRTHAGAVSTTGSHMQQDPDLHGMPRHRSTWVCWVHAAQSSELLSPKQKKPASLQGYDPNHDSRKVSLPLFAGGGVANELRHGSAQLTHDPRHLRNYMPVLRWMLYRKNVQEGRIYPEVEEMCSKAERQINKA